MYQALNVIMTLLFIAIIVGLIKPSVYNGVARRSVTRKLVLVTLGVAFLILGIILAAIEPASVKEAREAEAKQEQQEKVTRNTKAQATPAATSKPADSLPTEPIARIEALIKAKYDKFEVTLMTADFKYAATGNGPWSVVVNVTPNQVQDCTAAKRLTYEAMKAVYTDSIAEANVSRVRVNIVPQATASLGATDGKSISDDLWTKNGPTNTINALKGSGTSEKEGVPLDQQTYWNARTGCAE